MLKNAYFLEKDAKISSASGAPPPNPVGLRRLGVADPRDVTPVYYYNFVKFIASSKCGLLHSKQKKFCFFQIFAAIFHLKLCSFC